MTLATWHWHIEISSKCTLRCPRCARQEVPGSLINTELNLDFFKRNFTPEFIRSNVEKMTFCGDDGDPIYAHDLVEVIGYIKNIKPVEIVIVTNGSYKSIGWWESLGRVLTAHDSVHFSIDGYDHESNIQYRVNSDWQSIMDGIWALRAATKAQLIWAAIAFRFNEDHIDQMVEQARTLGMDRFQLTKSTKFGSVYPSYGADDALEPSEKFISSSHRFERDVIALTEAGKWNNIPLTNLTLFSQTQIRNNVRPLCEIGNKGLYIDARGRLYPCCWVANRYSHNTEWSAIAERFNLNRRSLAEVLTDDFWTQEFQTFRWQECQTKCNSRVVNQEYATQW
jgi:MoaA/NifB/PqqE/SkfB family radical SAM enzyme